MEGYNVPGILLIPAIILEFAAPILIIVGYKTKIAAFLLATFCMTTALIFHTDFSIQFKIHPSPPPSETHRAADDTRRGREDQDRDPSPATRRLERDFARGKWLMAAAALFRSSRRTAVPIGPRRRRATPRRDSRFRRRPHRCRPHPRLLSPPPSVTPAGSPARRVRRTAVSRWTGTFRRRRRWVHDAGLENDAGFPRRVRFPEPGRGPDDVPRLYQGRAARRARRAARIAMRVGERRRERNVNARFFSFLSFSSRTRTVRSRVIRFARTRDDLVLGARGRAAQDEFEAAYLRRTRASFSIAASIASIHAPCRRRSFRRVDSAGRKAEHAT